MPTRIDSPLTIDSKSESSLKRSDTHQSDHDSLSTPRKKARTENTFGRTSLRKAANELMGNKKQSQIEGSNGNFTKALNEPDEINETLEQVKEKIGKVDTNSEKTNVEINFVKGVREEAWKQMISWNNVFIKCDEILNLVDGEKNTVPQQPQEQLDKKQPSQSMDSKHDNKRDFQQQHLDQKQPSQSIDTNYESKTDFVAPSKDVDDRTPSDNSPFEPLDENDKRYISYETFLNIVSAEKYKDHLQTLEWAGGIIYCRCCGNQRISHISQLFRHTRLPRHESALKTYCKEYEQQQDLKQSSQIIDANHKDNVDRNRNNLRYISRKSFLNLLRIEKYEDHYKTLEWSEGEVYCRCCAYQRISHITHLFRHIRCSRHKTAHKTYCKWYKLQQQKKQLDQKQPSQSIDTNYESKTDFAAPPKDVDDRTPSNNSPFESLDENDKRYISHESFLSILSDEKYKHHDLHYQTLEWAGGIIYCRCCGNQQISQIAQLFRHTQTPRHKIALLSYCKWHGITFGSLEREQLREQLWQPTDADEKYTSSDGIPFESLSKEDQNYVFNLFGTKFP